MCATRTDREEAVLFRSYRVQVADETASPSQDQNATNNRRDCNPDYIEPELDIGFDDISIGDAARATSSAPTYFEPKVIHEVKFWDGGMLNNNPIDQVWNARDDIGKPATFVLSLGCSYPLKRAYSALPLLNLISQATSYITNTEAKHRDFERMIQRRNLKLKQNEKIQYFRLNVPTGRESLNLDDWKKMETLTKYTEQYLQSREAQDAVLRCAHALARPSQSTLREVVNDEYSVDDEYAAQIRKAAESMAKLKSEMERTWYEKEEPMTASRGRDLKPPPKAAYLTRIWSMARQKSYQTRPFLDRHCPANIISEAFAQRMGVVDNYLDKHDQHTAMNASGQTIENLGSIKLEVQLFREGNSLPETRELTFHVKKTGINVVGDVLLGRDVFGHDNSKEVH